MAFRILSQLTPAEVETAREGARRERPLPPPQPSLTTLRCGHPFEAIALDEQAVDVCILCTAMTPGGHDARAVLKCPRCKGFDRIDRVEHIDRVHGTSRVAFECAAYKCEWEAAALSVENLP